jgi:hypothetical protein
MTGIDTFNKLITDRMLHRYYMYVVCAYAYAVCVYIKTTKEQENCHQNYTFQLIRRVRIVTKSIY